MIQVLTHQMPPRTSGAASQSGPVLLATKPVHGRDAPLAVARWLADREDRELHVVTVVPRAAAHPMVTDTMPAASNFYEAERTAIATRMQRELGHDRVDRAVSTIDVLQGSPADAVVDAARERDARVIVIGTGGYPGLGRHVFGERALQILATTDRPVLVVPPTARAGSVAVAVVAVDFSPSSIRAACAVFPMLSEGGRLALVHAETGDGTADAGGANARCEWRCASLFEPFLRQLPRRPDIAIDTACVTGDAVNAVVDYATSCNAGLIACGRTSQSFVERLFVQSTRSDLVRRTTCPVLVAPELPGDRAG